MLSSGRRSILLVRPAGCSPYLITSGAYVLLICMQLGLLLLNDAGCILCAQYLQKIRSLSLMLAADNYAPSTGACMHTTVRKPCQEHSCCHMVMCAWQCRCLELTDNDPKYTMFAFGTGYLNVLGQAANLGCSAYLTADCINFIVQMTNGHQFSPLEILLTYASELPPSVRRV